MIYFFTWDNDYEISEAVKSWKHKFVEKYWDFNLFHIKDISWYAHSELSDILFSMSFMSDKKLIIIEGFPNSDNKDFDDFFLDNVEKIPSETICLFSSFLPDKRSKIYKKLIKCSDKVSEFKEKSDFEVFSFIEKKFSWKIEKDAINLLISYKKWNLSKMVNELEKLTILYDSVSASIIREHVIEDLDDSIFDFIGELMSCNYKSSIDKMRSILWQTNIYAFYSALVTNLSNTYFIEMYKNLWKDKAFIVSELNLWKKWFLVDKRHKIKFTSLEKLYLDILSIDEKMKTWALLDSWDSYIIYELEKSILKNID